MPDGGKTPPKRWQTQAERDAQGLAAKKERDSARATGSSHPVELPDEVTGKHEGEELQQLRSLRPTDLRFAHLEGRVDDVVSELGDVRADIGLVRGEVEGMRGETKGEMGIIRGEFSAGMAGVSASIGSLAGEVKGLATVVNDQGKRQHTTFTATVDVDTASKKADIDVSAAAKKEKLSRNTKIIAGVIAILSSGTVLGWLLGTH